jgi:hypothetical protein
MQDPSLVLHLGLPKTGTTYLQSEVFPAMKSIRYIYKPRSDILRGTVGPEYGLMHRCFGQSTVLWREYGDAIFGAILGCSMDHYRAEKTLLISDEGICMGGRHCLPGHLQELKRKAVGWGFGRLKVICTIRRQCQWMGSQYAQMSNRVRGAGQADFENYVDSLMDYERGFSNGGVLLDYLTLREQLVAGVGRDNVLMLPLEMLAKERIKFLAELGAFIKDGDSDDSEYLMKLNEVFASKRNVRSSRPDAWDLRPLGGRRLRLLPRSVQALGLAAAIPLRLPDFRRERSVLLSDPLRAKITTFYAEHNRLLEKEIGFDLRSYGYY